MDISSSTPVLVPCVKRPTMYPNKSRSTLSCEQINRLMDILNEPFEVHGIGNFPTLTIRLRDFLPEVSRRVNQSFEGRTDGHETGIRYIRMNGGVASHIVASSYLPFNDIDLIFGVDLCTSPAHSFEAVKSAVLDSILEFFPSGTLKNKISHSTLKGAYVRKLVKVTDGDVWSLLSLNNHYGRFIELKFVDRMRRQFEFSVDSFQIHLDEVIANFSTSPPDANSSSDLKNMVILKSLTSDSRVLSDADSVVADSGRGESEQGDSDAEEDEDTSHDCSQGSRNESPKIHDQRDQSGRPMSRNGPMVANSDLNITVESKFGDFNVALRHLNEKLIDTKRPEEIRGGGLLKYCKLLAKGYRAARPKQLRHAERYMCSRFFIDFPDIGQQFHKINAYLEGHFSNSANDPGLTYDYLCILYDIISTSTVCLMSHERKLTLEMIDCLIRQVANEITRPASFATALCGAMSTQCTLGGGPFPNGSPGYAGNGTFGDMDKVVPYSPQHTIIYLSHNGSYWMPISMDNNNPYQNEPERVLIG